MVKSVLLHKGRPTKVIAKVMFMIFFLAYMMLHLLYCLLYQLCNMKMYPIYLVTGYKI